MVAARRKEREYFANSPDYKHLAHRMGSEHLAKVLSKVCARLLFLKGLSCLCVRAKNNKLIRCQYTVLIAY